ncbi:MAG: DUF5320 domain-containing protein [Candidatus Omnitrophica bacterium]|nr:DUF5320 domain-containing protein [Candidatus Omnitrophota bacterium]
MPGFNGTGPNGQGAFTGGGRGYCVGYLNVAGRGARFGKGLGRGFGRKNLNRGRGGQYQADANPALEVEGLKEQAQLIQEELGMINQRIKELESK